MREHLRTALVAAALLAATTIPAIPVSAQSPSGTPEPIVISGEGTDRIEVWVPEGTEGTWPVVYAVPGASGSGDELSVIAEQLASHGVLVFVTDHHGPDALPQTIADVECGYRFMRDVAAEYGGDLGQPVTMFGHSMGASAVLVHGLGEDQFGPGGAFGDCGGGAPRPDVIVSLSGCHYGLGDATWDFDMSGFGNTDARLALVVGTADPDCQAWQSEQATTALRDAGYQVDLTEIDGGDHMSVISMADGGDALMPDPDEPAGMAVVQAILDAIDAARGV